MIKALIIYLVIANLIGLLVMGLDKKRAAGGGWRIREKTLFLVSILGGSLGTLMGMYIFHHKTRHWYFVVGMPLILIIHLALAWFLAGRYL